MSAQLVDHILSRLGSSADEIQLDFTTSKGVPTRFAVVDALLPNEIALEIFSCFPPPHGMRRLSSIRERKYTTKALDEAAPLVRDIAFAFQDERVVQMISSLTGVREPVADPSFYAGGLSAMVPGDFLNPHIDNSHDFERQHFRVLNLLYYVTPDWHSASGGHLEMWDQDVRKCVRVTSDFNRLVLMATNNRSWHSVSKVVSPGPRSCVSNYYFSAHSPNNTEDSHVTYFTARPEQRLRRILTKTDSELRTIFRRVRPSGLARPDQYRGTNERRR